MKNHSVDVRDETYTLIEKGFSASVICEVDPSNPISPSDKLTLTEYTSEGFTGRHICVRVVNINESHEGLKDGFCLVTFFYKPTIQRIQNEIIDRLSDPNESEDEKNMSLDAGLDIIRLFLNHGLMPDIMETCAEYARVADKEHRYSLPVYNIMDLDDEVKLLKG